MTRNRTRKSTAWLVASIALISVLAVQTEVMPAHAQEERTVIAVDAELGAIGEKYFGGYLQVYADGQLCGELSFTDPAQRTPDAGAALAVARADQPAACGRSGAAITFFDGRGVALSNRYSLEPGSILVIDWLTVGAREGLAESPTADGRTLLTVDVQLRGETVTSLDVYADGEACGRFSFAESSAVDGGAAFELARGDQPAACGREGAIITLVGENGVQLAAIYRLRLGYNIPIQNFTIPPPHTGGGGAPTPAAPEVGSGLATESGGSPVSRVAGVSMVAVLVAIAVYVLATRRRKASC